MATENRIYSYLPETEKHKKLIKQLAVYPDEILQKIATNFTEKELQDKEAIKKIADTMFEVMEYFGGIGLAAQQANFLKRILVMHIEDENKYAADSPFVCTDTKTGARVEPHRMVVINPEILESSTETSVLKEGCLSVPEIKVNVIRPISVTVKFLDENLEEKIYHMESLLAKCMQHEINHLDGILIVDKAPVETKKLILNPKLARLAKMRR
jgi:peptide deformylase